MLIWCLSYVSELYEYHLRFLFKEHCGVFDLFNEFLNLTSLLNFLKEIVH